MPPQLATPVRIRRRKDLGQGPHQVALSEILSHLVFLFLDLADVLDVVTHHPRHDAEKCPGAVDGEDHKDQLGPGHEIQQRGDLVPLLTVHEGEQGEHGICDGVEHQACLLGDVSLLAEQFSSADGPGGQNGESIQRHKGEHKHPEHALHGADDTYGEHVERPDGSNHPHQTQDPHETQQPRQRHQLAETTPLLLALRDKAPRLQYPVVHHTAGNDCEVEDVPATILGVGEVLPAPVPDPQHGFHDEEGEHELLRPLEDRRLDVGFQAHDNCVENDHHANRRLEEGLLHPGEVCGQQHSTQPDHPHEPREPREKPQRLEDAKYQELLS
mmetsp:Transcript_80465/g.192969  ORF Transcript_80465/g.192969 Transcript_80465/m.192969 type:complete len:328 (+) Transcript_80465:930-1913(+)